VSTLAELLIEPVARYGFMQAGLVAATVVGVTCAVLSCLLVVRGQALLGDAISHAVLLGVVLGFLVGGEVGILAGAMLVAVLTGAAIAYVTQHAPFRADTSMGVLFTVTFALGLAIMSVVQPRGIDLFHVLFGNVLGVTAATCGSRVSAAGSCCWSCWWGSVPSSCGASTPPRPRDGHAHARHGVPVHRPAVRGDRGRPADRGPDPGGRDAGDPRRDRRDADLPAVDDDGRGGSRGPAVGGRRALRLVPPRRRLGAGDRAGRRCVLRGGLRPRAPRGRGRAAGRQVPRRRR
jgi:hypothetical protein